jgi:hypothetical protein
MMKRTDRGKHARINAPPMEESHVPGQEPFIDAHSHIWTPDVAHYPLAQRYTRDDMKPPSFTAEELLAQCLPAREGPLQRRLMRQRGRDERLC